MNKEEKLLEIQIEKIMEALTSHIGNVGVDIITELEKDVRDFARDVPFEGVTKTYHSSPEENFVRLQVSRTQIVKCWQNRNIIINKIKSSNKHYSLLLQGFQSPWPNSWDNDN